MMGVPHRRVGHTPEEWDGAAGTGPVPQSEGRTARLCTGAMSCGHPGVIARLGLAAKAFACKQIKRELRVVFSVSSVSSVSNKISQHMMGVQEPMTMLG